MASNRHASPTGSRKQELEWACQHCGQPTTNGWLAIHRRQIRHILNGQRPRGWWRTWCRTCPPQVVGSGRLFQARHYNLPLATLTTVEDIDTATIRLAAGPEAAWMGRTNWAEITSAGGTEGAAAA